MKLMRFSPRLVRGAAVLGLALSLALGGLRPVSAALAAPAASPALTSAACAATYVVKAGDTLLKIAAKYNVKWTNIAAANSLSHPNWIYPGQALCIPSGAAIPQPGTTRIRFPAGATTVNFTGTVQAGQLQYYVLKAWQSQPMMVNVVSPNNDVTLSVMAQTGASLMSASAPNWQGKLPVMGDYYLKIQGGAANETYTLTVSIAARIQFAPGAYQRVLTGKTVTGFTVLYVASARQGQTMSLALSGAGSDAVLTVWGFDDGQPYLRYVTEQTSFSMRLPATEDYMIGVMPRAGAVVPYTLTVKIQ